MSPAASYEMAERILSWPTKDASDSSRPCLDVVRSDPYPHGILADFYAAIVGLVMLAATFEWLL